MKKLSSLILLLVLSVGSVYGQTELENQSQTIDEPDDSGAVTYNINRKSNIIEYPFGYSQPTLKSTPLRLSLILLQEGEKILSMSAGDTRRWKFTQTYQGSSGDVTPIIQVKPVTDGITTNLIVTTDRRTYDITLEAPEIEGNSTNPSQFFTRRISFYYPDEENFGSVAVSTPPPAEKADNSSEVDTTEKVSTDGGKVDISDLHMRYDLEEGKYGFPWEPVKVYDNGTHAFIEIPDDIEAQELPALFVVNEAGDRHNINFSFNPDTRTLKTDRLFKKAVLTYKFKHPGFLGLGTVTDEKELFIIRQ